MLTTMMALAISQTIVALFIRTCKSAVEHVIWPVP
jgi:hypothetical protein